MSNLKEYTTKLDCAWSIVTTIEMIKELLQKAEDEYAFFLRECGLRNHLKGLSSTDILCLKYRARQKNYERWVMSDDYEERRKKRRGKR